MRSESIEHYQEGGGIREHTVRRDQSGSRSEQNPTQRLFVFFCSGSRIIGPLPFVYYVEEEGLAKEAAAIRHSGPQGRLRDPVVGHEIPALLPSRNRPGQAEGSGNQPLLL